MTNLSALAIAGTTLAVRVTPNARANVVEVADGVLRIRVTAVPEDGKANEAVRTLLAQALGVARTRLTLIRGATSRDKVFRLD
jgi:uncharacterized protein YggU (UPF0235/DUF167 family)